MNRLRQIKVEKDNENNDIKRGGHRNHKAPLSARGLYPKVEVCNARLNRIKKALSNEYGMPITNCPAMTTIGGRVPLCTGKHKSRNGSTRMGSLTPRGPNMFHNASTMPMSAMMQQRMLMSQSNAQRAQQGYAGQQPFMRRNNNSGDGGGNSPATNGKSGKGHNVESVSVLPLEFGKRRKIKLASAFLLPDKENKSFVYLCKPVKKVKEILTARELNDSTDNFRQRNMATPSSGTLCREREQADLYASAKSLENSTTDEFELAPLLPLKPRSSTSSSIAELSSARVFMNVRELLNRQKHEMLPEDLDTIKDVVKTDARYHQLQKDDELFKDILRTQLEEIRKQETLVETALSALEVQSTNTNNEHEKDEEIKESVQKSITEQSQKSSKNYNVQKSAKLEKCETGVVPCDANLNSATTVPEQLEAATTPSTASMASVIELEQLNALAKRKKEIDLVLKNIPNLQREIKMLHAIGEKLESTLRSSKDEHETPNIEKQSSTIYYTPCEDTAQLLQRLEFPSMLNGCGSFARIGLSWSLAPTRMAQTLARSCGICHAYGCIKEFRIEQKTLTELKNANDDNQWFYIPVNEDRTELKRTSFGKLKDDPDLLMQYLKPRSQTTSFNLLEQDPMFLSSIMYTPNNDKMFDEMSSSEHLLLHDEGRDCCRSNRRRCSVKTKSLSVGATVKPNTGLTDDKQSSKYATKRIHCCKSRNEQYFLQPCRCQPCPNMSDVMTLPTMDVNAMQKLFMQQFLSDAIMPSVEECGNMVDASTATNPSLHKLDNKSSKASVSLTLPTLPTPPAATPDVVNVIEEKAKILLPPVLPSSRVKVQKPNTPERLSGGKNQQQQQQQPRQIAASELTSTSLSPSVFSMPVPITRRSMRRSSTPLSLSHTHVEPKSHLLKTVIVGVVQITVFLLLIMAFTYPDVHC